MRILVRVDDLAPAVEKITRTVIANSSEGAWPLATYLDDHLGASVG